MTVGRDGPRSGLVGAVEMVDVMERGIAEAETWLASLVSNPPGGRPRGYRGR